MTEGVMFIFMSFLLSGIATHLQRLCLASRIAIINRDPARFQPSSLNIPFPLFSRSSLVSSLAQTHKLHVNFSFSVRCHHLIPESRAYKKWKECIKYCLCMWFAALLPRGIWYSHAEIKTICSHYVSLKHRGEKVKKRPLDVVICKVQK
jgi:hypothetical protein